MNKYFKRGYMFVLGVLAALFMIAISIGLGSAIAMGLFEVIKPYLK